MLASEVTASVPGVVVGMVEGAAPLVAVEAAIIIIIITTAITVAAAAAEVRRSFQIPGNTFVNLSTF